MLGGGCRWCKRSVNGPRNISRGGRERGKSHRQRRGIDGLRDVTEDAALMCATMLDGRSLMLAIRAVGRDRTARRPGEGIGPHGNVALNWRENLRQESQQ